MIRVLRQSHLFRHLLFVSVLILAGPRVHGATGLSFSLGRNSMQVSGYEQSVVRFDAALYPRSEFLFENKTRKAFVPLTANGRLSLLRSQETYYKLGPESWTLIPSAADGATYADYRFGRYYETAFRRELEKRQAATAKQKSQGLGVSIQLPGGIDRIVGEGGAGLKVGGTYRIDLEGRKNTTDNNRSDVSQGSGGINLRMKQIYRFDINGTIGSKISVKVSEDNQTDIPLANRVQLRFKGDEDDILRVVEAGNTALSLPNTEFSGYSESVRGLFGIKAEAQLGPVRFIGIASQEKGSSERASVTPTGEENAEIVRDWNYAEGRIFDLGLPGEFAPGDTVTGLQVYEEKRASDRIVENYARFYVKPNDTLVRVAENVSVDSVAVTRLDASSFVWRNDRETPYLVFPSASSQQMLGVWMTVFRRATGREDTIGVIGQDSAALRLKLLKPRSVTASPQDTTWILMWRNCYVIPKGAAIEDMTVKVFKGATGTEASEDNLDYQENELGNNKYITILGLDQRNSSATGERFPDGKLDNDINIFKPEWGLLIFPHRRPFAPTQSPEGLTYPGDTLSFITASGQAAPKLREQVPNIYDTKTTDRQTSSTYYITIATTSRSSQIRLGRPNVIEGSERVTVNGRPLSRDTDYSINYDFGQITLLAPEALDPNADVQVEFEYAPFFSLQKKSLLGGRMEMALSENLSIGTMALFKSDKTENRKPRVGEETAKITAYSADAKLTLSPNFLTKAANLLPFYSTVAPSRLALSGEVAQSRPNPNTDGVGYVDDFETATEELTLGNTRLRWTVAPRPSVLQSDYKRAKLLWHSPDPDFETLPRHEDIYESEARPNESTIRTLRMVFRPNTLDTLYDTSLVPNGALVDTNLSIRAIQPGLPRNSWAGIIRRFFGVDAKRAQLFEMRARVSQTASIKMHLDFGVIREELDVSAATLSRTFTEDADNNGSVSTEEDIGLDGLPDALEDPRKFRGGILDPNADNFYYDGIGDCPLGAEAACRADSLRYEWLNGTEGNISDNSADPDREAIGASLESNDAYFSYVIDFANSGSLTDADSLVVPGSEKNGWKTYRIPIRDSLYLDTAISSQIDLVPDWNKVSHIRVWFEGVPGQTTTDTVEIAEWQFVQANWQDSLIYYLPVARTSAFTVATISEEDGTFTPPPGVTAYEDPTTNVKEPQRGLQLKFADLKERDTCLAFKELLNIERYGGYRSMEMYVNAELPQTADNKIRFFFRLGQDARNYYEVSRLLRVASRWDPVNFVEMDFNQLTAFKDSLIRALPPNQPVDTGDPVRGWRVVGRPNINQVRYFASGVINTDTLSTHSGEVWLDELRVTDVRRDVGTAGRISVSGTVADLFDYSGSFRSVNAFFRRVSSPTRGGSADNLGSGRADENWTYMLRMQLDRFLPKSWAASFPISYSQSRTQSVPILRTNSDVVLADEVRLAERSVSRSENFSVSGSVNRKGRNPLFNLLLNRLKTSFSYLRSFDTSVTIPSRFGENTSISGSFNLGVGRPPKISPLTWSKKLPFAKKLSKTNIYLYPSSWSVSSDFARTISVSDDVFGVRTTSLGRTLNAKMDLGYKLFDNLSTTWSFNTNRDLNDLDRVNVSFKDLRLGRETRYGQTASGAYSPKLLPFLTTSVTARTNYNENFEFQTSTRRITLSNEWGVSGSFNQEKLFGKEKPAERIRTQRGGRRTIPEKRAPVDTTAADSTKPELPGKLPLDADSTRTPGDSLTKKSDSTSKAKEKERVPGTPIYTYALRAARALTGFIEPIQYSYGETYNDNQSGLKSRPEFPFLLAIDRKPLPASIRGQASTPQTTTMGRRVSGSSGFALFRGIRVNTSYAYSTTWDVRKQGALSQNISTTFPTFGVQIQRLEKFPIFQKQLNRFIQVFSPDFDYKRTVSTTLDISKGTGAAAFPTSKNIMKEFRPLLGLTFKAIKDVSLSGSYNYKLTETKRYDPLDGSEDGGTDGKDQSFGFGARYSFSSPGGIDIPIFGRLKFKSTMTLDLTYERNRALVKSKDAGGTRKSTDNTSNQYTINASYKFSQEVDGGVRGSLEDSRDNVASRTTRTQQLSIYAQLRF